MKATANAALLALSASEIKPERLNLPRCAHAVQEHRENTKKKHIACLFMRARFRILHLLWKPDI